MKWPFSEIELNASGDAPGRRMEERMSGFDWTTTSLGPVSAWPQSLKSAVLVLLDADRRKDEFLAMLVSLPLPASKRGRGSP